MPLPEMPNPTDAPAYLIFLRDEGQMTWGDIGKVCGTDEKTARRMVAAARAGADGVQLGQMVAANRTKRGLDELKQV
jgi:hypothetical protein